MEHNKLENSYLKKSDQSYILKKCIICLENQPRTAIDKTEPTKSMRL